MNKQDRGRPLLRILNCSNVFLTIIIEISNSPVRVHGVGRFFLLQHNDRVKLLAAENGTVRLNGLFQPDIAASGVDGPRHVANRHGRKAFSFCGISHTMCYLICH